MPYDLVCLGNLSIDDVVRPDGTTFLNCFGGDTIYAALGARWWSDSVGVVAPVGQDYPEENLVSLNRSGLETLGLPRRPIPGIHYQVTYANNNQRSWEMLSRAEDFFELSPRPSDVPPAYFNARAFLVLAMDLAAQEALVPALHPHGLLALDPQEEYIPGNEQRVVDMLKNVDIFLPSQEEVFLLLGHRDAEKACRFFASCGPRTVVIKQGQEGCLIFDTQSDSFYKIPTFPVTTLDTTGAGDTFCGGFMAMYARNGDLVKAGLAGAVSASYAVENFGLNHMFTVSAAEACQRLRELVAQF